MADVRTAMNSAIVLPPEVAALSSFSATPLAAELRAQARGAHGGLARAVRARCGASSLGSASALSLAASAATVPCAPHREHSWLRMPNDRFFSCCYSRDGSTFAAASQSTRIAVCDSADGGLRPRGDIALENVRWTVTCVGLLPDASALLYSTLHDAIEFVPLPRKGDELPLSQVRQVPLRLRSAGGAGFAVYSFAIAPGGTELAAATGDGRVVIYDLESSSVIDSFVGHNDDINSIAFASQHGERADTLVTASDDGLAKVFDRRTSSRVVGILPGHQAGLSSVSPRGDGVHVATAAKDSTIKVWDLRRAFSSEAYACLPAYSRRLRFAFDYRYEPPARELFTTLHTADRSLATLRGNVVLRTLVRCAWSPEASYGGRFIAAGSADGKVCLWDLLEGGVRDLASAEATGDGTDAAAPAGAGAAPAAAAAADADGYYLRGLGMPHVTLPTNGALVRDVAWHPTRPVLATAGWDGVAALWAHDPIKARAQASARVLRSTMRRALHQATAQRTGDAGAGRRVSQRLAALRLAVGSAAADAASAGASVGGSDEASRERNVAASDARVAEGLAAAIALVGGAQDDGDDVFADGDDESDEDGSSDSEMDEEDA